MNHTALRPTLLPSRLLLRANGLLAALPGDALDRLMPHIEHVTLAAGHTLCEAGAEMTHAYFPADAIVALMLAVDGHTPIKMALVGCEGVAGISTFMGSKRPYGSAVVLHHGSAFKIPAAVIQAEFEFNGAAMRLLLRYVQTLVTQMAQTAVCNRHHVVEQQLCAWLLTCLDRLAPRGSTAQGSPAQGSSLAPRSSLSFTQATVASMLGVRREAISEAAGNLRQLGLIAATRGRISLLDRPGLQARACECYLVVKRETQRLLPDRTAT